MLSSIGCYIISCKQCVLFSTFHSRTLRLTFSVLSTLLSYPNTTKYVTPCLVLSPHHCVLPFYTNLHHNRFYLCMNFIHIFRHKYQYKYMKFVYIYLLPKSRLSTGKNILCIWTRFAKK